MLSAQAVGFAIFPVAIFKFELKARPAAIAMDDDWIEKRLEAALKAQPVANAVASAIKDQLKGTMCERALKPAELAKIANSLLAQANPAAKESPQ